MGSAAAMAAAGLVVGNFLEVPVRMFGDARQSDVAASPWRPFPSPVRLRPALLALVTAVVLGALGGRLGFHAVLAPEAVIGAGFVALSAVDLQHYIIPNRILYPTMMAAVPLLALAAGVDHRWGSLARCAIAGAVGFAGMYAVHFVYPKGMGFGDVRLSAAVGLASGWFGLGHAFVAFLFGFMAGAIVGVVVMAVTGEGRKTRIPFGPFLAFGAMFAVVFGDPLARALFHPVSG